jgi:hypothetical protein
MLGDKRAEIKATTIAQIPHVYCFFTIAITDRTSDSGTNAIAKKKMLIIANIKAHIPIAELAGELTITMFPGLSLSCEYSGIIKTPFSDMCGSRSQLQ